MTVAAVPLALLDVSDVHEAMGSDPDLLATATPAIESAIVRAGIKLQTVLDTSLKPLTNTDIFYIDETLAPLNGRYRCRLKNGVVRQDQVGLPTIQWCDEVDGTFQDVLNPVVDYNRGMVQIPTLDSAGFGGAFAWTNPGRTPRRNFYVKVTYASGFMKGDTLPDELKHALLCYVPLLLLSTSSVTEAGPKQMYAATARAKTLDDSADDMLLEYMRRVAPSVKPFQHTQSALMV